MNTATTQPRAKIGGETGMNGAWYEGGKFIATTPMMKKEKAARKAQMKREEREAMAAAKRAAHAAIRAILEPILEARFGAQTEAVAQYRYVALVTIAAKTFGCGFTPEEVMEAVK